jgi:hypothetical protein
LGKELLSTLEKENDVEIVYGFSNANALPGHRKLNCIEVCELSIVVKILNVKRVIEKGISNKILSILISPFVRIYLNIAQRGKKPESVKDFSIIRIYEFDGRFDDFWKAVSKEHKIIMDRDRTYLNWRYAGDPNENYIIMAAEKDEAIMGLAVIRTIDRFDLRSGALVELIALPGKEYVLPWLISNIADYFKSQKVDLVACAIQKNTKAYNALRQCGFTNCPKRFKPRETNFIVYQLSQERDREMIANPDNWYITLGDTDVV